MKKTNPEFLTTEINKTFIELVNIYFNQYKPDFIALALFIGAKKTKAEDLRLKYQGMRRATWTDLVMLSGFLNKELTIKLS